MRKMRVKIRSHKLLKEVQGRGNLGKEKEEKKG